MTVAMGTVQAEFPAWYASLEVSEDAAVRQARYKGVTGAAKKANSEDIEALVRLAFETKKLPAAASVTKMREFFSAADDTFAVRDNGREMQILAAAILAQLMESSTMMSWTALAVSTAACNDARKPTLPFDILARAEAAIRRQAESNRTRPALGGAFSELKELDFSSAQSTITEANSFEAVAQAFDIAESAVRHTFAERAKEEQAFFRSIGDYLAIRDEELQMLWWLMGRRSETLDCAFSDVPPDALPFVLARELDSATTRIPGPRSAVSLLSQAGLRAQKKLAIKACIAAVPVDWAKGLIGEREFSPVTAPLHFGLQRRIENDGDNEWVSNWASVSGIAAGFTSNALDLGTQIYRERLLIHFT